MRARLFWRLVLCVTILACEQPAPAPNTLSSAELSTDRAEPADWQLLAVYVGSTGCGYGRDPELRAALQSMHAKLRAQAEVGEWRLSIAAVALDASPDSGFAYLKGLGPWNEMVVGGNWGNLGAETHIWRPADGVSSIPQIIVLERLAVSDTTRIRFGPNRVLKRYIGTEEVIGWIKSGAKLDAPGMRPRAS